MGVPISQVKVQIDGDRDVQTDQNGRFTVERTASWRNRHVTEEVVRFSAVGYKPQTRLLSIDEALTVILSRENQGTWKPTPCGSTKGYLTAWGPMAFAVPSGARVTRGAGEDTTGSSVAFGNNTLVLVSGSNWSKGLPGTEFFDERYVYDLRERSVQWLGNKEYKVAEYRGRRPTGYFRYIGVFGETVQYENADRQTAEYFDAILDTLCWKDTSLPTP